VSSCALSLFWCAYVASLLNVIYLLTYLLTYLLIRKHRYFRVSAIQVSGTRSVRLGDPIRLLCNVTESLAKSRDVGWYRGSSAVRSDRRAGVLVTRRSSDEPSWTELELAVSASSPRDAGRYTCRTVDRRLTSSIFVHVTPDGTHARLGAADNYDSLSIRRPFDGRSTQWHNFRFCPPSPPPPCRQHLMGPRPRRRLLLSCVCCCSCCVFCRLYILAKGPLDPSLPRPTTAGAVVTPWFDCLSKVIKVTHSDVTR